MFILPASSKYVNIPLVTNWTGFRTLFNVRLRGEIFVNAIHDRVGCWMNKDILHHTGWHRGRNFRLGVGRCCCPFQCRLYRQITQTGMFLEIPLGFEFVAQSASEIFQIFSRCCLKKRTRKEQNKRNCFKQSNGYSHYRRAIFLHRMSQFVMFRNSSREKAGLAHVET